MRAWCVLCLCIATDLVSAAPVDSNIMEEVVVVASRIPEPLWRVAGQVSVLHKDELQWQQVRKLGDIAHYLPALEEERASRFGSVGLAIRGVGGNRVLVEMDEVPLPRHFSIGEFANSARNTLDAGAIERIEVLRGPASAVYGSDAIGGVVQVISANPVTLGNRVMAEAGADASNGSMHQFITLSHRQGDSGGLLSLGHESGHETEAAAAAPVDEQDYEQWHLFGKWVHGLADNLDLALTADRYERDQQTDLRSPLGYGRQYASTVALHGDDAQQRQRISLGLTASEAGFPGDYSLLLYYQDNATLQRTRDFRAAGRQAADAVITRRIDREFRYDETSRGLEAVGHWPMLAAGIDQDVAAGFEWKSTTLEESRDGLSSDFVSGLVTKTLPPGELLPARDLPQTDVDTWALFVRDEIRLGRLALIPAVRWDRYQLDAAQDALVPGSAQITALDFDDLSIRFGMTWRATDNITAFAHYAEGFRAPPPEDVNLMLNYTGFVTVRALPNPDLRPEQSDNYELGLRIAPDSRSWVNLGIYHSSYDDLIESRTRVGVDPGDGALLFQSRNVESAEISGVELAAGLATKRLGLALNLHAARGDDRRTGQPLTFLSPPRAVLRMRLGDVSRSSMELIATHAREQDRVDTTAAPYFAAPSWTRLDLIMGFHPAPAWSINVAINNLNNETYWYYGQVRVFAPDDPRIGSLSQPPRSVAATLRVEI